MQTAIQLFTLRAINEPLSETIERVAATQFDAVELVGLPDDADDAAESLEDRELAVAGMHLSKDTIDQNFGSVLMACDTLECDSVVVPYLDESYFESRAAVEETADMLTETADQFADHDLQLLYHNHGHEFTDLGGISAFELLVEKTPEQLSFELDVGWAGAEGYDPLDLLDTLGDRNPMVHVKDVVYDTNAPAELGEGDVDLIDCVRKSREIGAEWAVYEHDNPSSATQSLETGSKRLTDYVQRTRA